MKRPRSTVRRKKPIFTLPLPFLRTKEAARMLGIAPRTLDKRRVQGTGPQYIKMGGRVLYDVQVLKAWLSSSIKRSTSDPDREGAIKPLQRKRTTKTPDKPTAKLEDAQS